MLKLVANIAGFDNWAKFTNHAARALGITMMFASTENPPTQYVMWQTRHKIKSSLQPYQRLSQEMNHKIHNAMIGTHAAKPQPQVVPRMAPKQLPAAAQVPVYCQQDFPPPALKMPPPATRIVQSTGSTICVTPQPPTQEETPVKLRQAKVMLSKVNKKWKKVKSELKEERSKKKVLKDEHEELKKSTIHY
jgi:hypothetical protein